MTRETVGKLSTDLLKESYANEHSAYEQMKEQLSDYEYNINLAVLEGIKNHEGDFFIVVLIKRERLMKNVMRLFFFSRKSCPTPQHEQVVYHYHRDSGDIEYLWTVPSLEACVTLYNEMLYAHPEERQLLKHVLDFRDGTLFRKALEYNGEIIT